MDAVAEIKSRLDVADIVGEYLTLKPAGSGSFKANCPFHQEKTPSFYVNRPRQSWHCFGCDLGGDLISFVQKMEGLDFPEALELLARKAGVQLPSYDPQAATEKQRMAEVNELASKFFRQALLTDPRADYARAYATKRGLDELTGDLWRIGYAPDSWDALTNALKAKGVTEQELVNAGLAIRRTAPDPKPTPTPIPTLSSVYDRFRNRLMFTIWDVNGRVIGFTGRILTDDKTQAKYVNTPETLLYKKSRVLYGLDKAKGEIKRQDLAVIVEGNMDVVSSHQFDIANVVAASGTALTADQLALIKRFTTNLAIAFDADNAGNAATVRGLDLARAQDFNIKIITLPPEAGKDADEAVRKNPELWKQAIRDAQPVVEWLYRNAFRAHELNSPLGKKQIAASFLPELRRISDAVERDAWLKRLAKDLDVNEDALREALRNVNLPKNFASPVSPARPSGTEQTETPKKPSKTMVDGLIERIQAILYLKPELWPLAEPLQVAYDQLRSTDDELSNYLAILADREFQDQSLATLQSELVSTVAYVTKLLASAKRENLERQMREAELAGDQARIADLLAQFQSLLD